MTRRGLVLGAGGALGASWTVGALTALEEALDWDVRAADVLVGTSAGSVVAAMLAGGVGVDALRDHQQGVAEPDHARFVYDFAAESARPPLPRLRLGSRSLLLRSALTPWHVSPLQAVSALLLEGRGSLGHIGSVVEQVVGAGQWPSGPETWIVAMDFDTGARVAFGRDGSPPADLAAAVMASCSIPGWYAPVVIGGHRYVDGGAVSPASLDLVAGGGLDVVYVLAPMSSLGHRPSTAAGRFEHYLRSGVTRKLRRQAAAVRAAGTDVVLIGPTAEDLDAIGANLMDPRRRQRVLETSLRTSPANVTRALTGDKLSAAG